MNYCPFLCTRIFNHIEGKHRYSIDFTFSAQSEKSEKNTKEYKTFTTNSAIFLKNEIAIVEL